MKSELGASFRIANDTFESVLMDFDGLGLSGGFGNYLSGLGEIGEVLAEYPNPFEVGSEHFDEIKQLVCTQIDRDSIAYITNVAMTCGSVSGTPRRLNGSASSFLQKGSWWT